MASVPAVKTNRRIRWRRPIGPRHHISSCVNPPEKTIRSNVPPKIVERSGLKNSFSVLADIDDETA